MNPLLPPSFVKTALKQNLSRFFVRFLAAAIPMFSVLDAFTSFFSPTRRLSSSHLSPSSRLLPVAVRVSVEVMDDSINQETITDNNAYVNNNLSVNSLLSNVADNPNPPNSNDSQSQDSSNLREKTNLAWKYVSLQIVNGKPQYQCLFCLQVFNGGKIHRMKKHLAKITGDVKKYPKVPYDVEKQMKNLLKEIHINKNKRKVSSDEEGGDEVEDAIDEAIAQEEQQRTSSQQVVGGDRKKKVKKEKEKRKQKIQYDPIGYKSINLVDFWVTKEVVEKEPDRPSNVNDLLRDIDADLYQSGSGSNGLYAASLDSSTQESRNEGEDDSTEANL
ncbi:hypothetical protein Ahy_B07g087716 [Arachis hypogaea]|uniref:BED-type domain-containing protein n=1 Tax=Arachis hypogaea TaxID=3818 RepID=A0A444YCT9_ARAHY|nr:hypothetical protein Ahy_B07g087716 [Arachis hypogaea]